MKKIMALTNSWPIFGILLTALVLRLMLIVTANSHPDLGNHIDWGIKFWEYGPRRFYEMDIWGVSWPNQPIGSMYLFAFIKVIKDLIFNFFLFLNNSIPIFPSKLIFILETDLHAWLLKLPFVLADIGIGYLIYRIIKNQKIGLANLAAILFLFNPLVFYNSAVWGQTDSLINLLAIWGIYLIIKKKYNSGIPILLSSFLFKMSLLIYLPVLFIVFLKRLKEWKKFILPASLFALFAILIALPFSGTRNPLEWLLYLYRDKVFNRQGHMLNGNAFNLWSLLYSIDITKNEYLEVLGLSAKTIGSVLFSVPMIAIMVSLFRKKITLNSVFTACLLTSFSAFLLMTNMHERYLYPIFPIITILIFTLPNLFSFTDWFFLSAIHLINLYNLWFYPDFPTIKGFLIYNNFMVCRILSIILFLFCIKGFKNYLKSEK